jgi:hypothetical protein
MKFDIIIGNPPYQNSNNAAKNVKLWHKFVNQSLELISTGGHIKLVTPASVLGETGFGKKMVSVLSSQYDLKKIDYTTSTHFPNVGVSICHWNVVNQPYQGETVVVDEEGEYKVDLREGLPLRGERKIIYDILNKIDLSEHDRIPLTLGQPISSDEYTEDGKYDIYHTGFSVKKTNTVPTTGDKLKVVVPFSSSYKNHFVTNGYVGMFNTYMNIKDEQEGRHIQEIMNHPLIQFYSETYKRKNNFPPYDTTTGFVVAVKYGRIPYINNFDNLEEQFNFTSEEVEYLQSINVL